MWCTFKSIPKERNFFVLKKKKKKNDPLLLIFSVTKKKYFNLLNWIWEQSISHTFHFFTFSLLKVCLNSNEILFVCLSSMYLSTPNSEKKTE